MEDVQDRELYSERVVMDEKNFSDCQFHDCELVYHGGPVTFSETVIMRRRWSFGGSAHRTLGLLQCFGLEFPVTGPELN